MLGVRCWMLDVSVPSQTLAGTAKRYESSGIVGGLPSGPTRFPAANLLHGKASAAWEPAPPINAQLQLGVWRAERRWNRFSGFSFPRARAHSRPNLAPLCSPLAFVLESDLHILCRAGAAEGNPHPTACGEPLESRGGVEVVGMDAG